MMHQIKARPSHQNREISSRRFEIHRFAMPSSCAIKIHLQFKKVNFSVNNNKIIFEVWLKP